MVENEIKQRTREMNKKESYLNISIQKNEGENKAVISIDGFIGEDPFVSDDEQNTLTNMREKLKEIASIDADEIEVNINSLGGSVDQGLAIHDLLASNSATVKTKITGMSASSATIIFQAGDQREISANGMMLIHRAWTMGLGNSSDFDALAKDLKKTDGVIADIYAKRGDRDADFYLDLMSENGGDGRWLDSDEAVEFGLVDNSVEPAFKKVAMSKSVFEKLGLPVPELKVESDEREPNMTYTIGLEVQGIEEIKDQLKEIQNINERKKDIDATEEKSSPEEPIANNNTNKGATSAERQRQLTLLNFKTKQQDG